jgi:predicted CoA-binding protein
LAVAVAEKMISRKVAELMHRNHKQLWQQSQIQSQESNE